MRIAVEFVLCFLVFSTDFGPGFTVLDINGENPHAGPEIFSVINVKIYFHFLNVFQGSLLISRTQTLL